MQLTIDWITGFNLGIEHLDYSDMEEDIGYSWALVFHLGIVRLIFTK